MVTALDDISFRVSQRETVAVMGPSGSGKTTLLNLIGGLDRPTHGSVATLGLRLNDLSERELTAFRAHLIGLVFQDPHLLPGLSALENVVAARIPWQARRELERGARGLLNAVGLRERMDFPPARLSGGERQRVGIARSLLGKPRLLLADEPTGNLDAGTTLDVLDLLAQLHADLGLTMVVVTHDATVASRADRVVRLAGGHVVG
jgi:putative ABC transport system ATP-binding protein